MKNTQASEEAEGGETVETSPVEHSLKTAQVSLSLSLYLSLSHLNPLKISRVFLESHERCVSNLLVINGILSRVLIWHIIKV